MAQDIIEIAVELIRAIFILFVLYIMYQVIRAILGGTWATENIIIAGMGIILAGLFVIVGFQINQSNSIGKLEEKTRNIEQNLNNLQGEFRDYKDVKSNRRR